MNEPIPPHLVHDDSLLGCLVTLTEYFGHPQSAQALSSGLPLPGNRLTLQTFPRAAARANCSSKIVRLQLSDIQAPLLPAILLLNGDRACVLLEVRGDICVIQYPEAGSPVEIPTAQLREAHAGLVVFVKPLFRFEPRARSNVEESSRHWFWSAMFHNRGLYRDAMIASVLVNIFALAMPLFTLNVYDRVLPNNAVETLWVLASGIVLVIIFNLVLSSARAYVLDTASKKVDVRLSAQIMERVLDLRMESRPASVGSFAANLRSFETVRDFIASASLTTVVDLPFVLLLLGVLWWIAPVMIFPLIVAIVVVLLISFVAQLRIGRLVKETFQAAAQRNATLVESLSGLETVKILNAQSEMQRRWESSTEFLARMNARIKRLSSVAAGSVQTVQQLTTVAVVVIGAYLVQDAAISMGGIIAASMITGRCLAPFGQVAGLLMQFRTRVLPWEQRRRARPSDALLIMRDAKDGSAISGYLFMPPAVRLGLSGTCDLRAIKLGLEWLRQHYGTLSLRVSLASLLLPGFLQEKARVLSASEIRPSERERLVLEVDAHGFVAYPEELESFCSIAANLGVGVGVRRLAEQPAALLRLHKVSIRYIKLGGDLISGLLESPGATQLIAAITEAAIGQGVKVYAHDVPNAPTAALLREYGVLLPEGEDFTYESHESDGSFVDN